MWVASGIDHLITSAQYPGILVSLRQGDRQHLRGWPHCQPGSLNDPLAERLADMQWIYSMSKKRTFIVLSHWAGGLFVSMPSLSLPWLCMVFVPFFSSCLPPSPGVESFPFIPGYQPKHFHESTNRQFGQSKSAALCALGSCFSPLFTGTVA